MPYTPSNDLTMNRRPNIPMGMPSPVRPKNGPVQGNVSGTVPYVPGMPPGQMGGAMTPGQKGDFENIGPVPDMNRGIHATPMPQGGDSRMPMNQNTMQRPQSLMPTRMPPQQASPPNPRLDEMLKILSGTAQGPSQGFGGSPLGQWTGSTQAPQGNPFGGGIGGQGNPNDMDRMSQYGFPKIPMWAQQRGLGQDDMNQFAQKNPMSAYGKQWAQMNPMIGGNMNPMPYQIPGGTYPGPSGGIYQPPMGGAYQPPRIGSSGLGPHTGSFNQPQYPNQQQSPPWFMQGLG